MSDIKSAQINLILENDKGKIVFSASIAGRTIDLETLFIRMFWEDMRFFLIVQEAINNFPGFMKSKYREELDLKKKKTHDN